MQHCEEKNRNNTEQTYGLCHFARCSSNVDERRMHASWTTTKANYHPKPKCAARHPFGGINGCSRAYVRAPWARYKHNEGRMYARDTIVKKILDYFHFATPAKIVIVIGKCLKFKYILPIITFVQATLMKYERLRNV